MLTVVENKTDSQTIAIPPNEMKRLGINNGDEIEISRNANDEIILRNAAETERKRRLKEATDKVFEEWDDVFVALAKGVDDVAQPDKSSAGNFVLSKTEDEKYKFVLTGADGKMIFESSSFESQDNAIRAIEEMKNRLSEIKDKILNFPVKTETESI